MQENQVEEKSFRMPIKVKPYKHQLEAFIFALKVMGFAGASDEKK